jgi:hypothetical protein
MTPRVPQRGQVYYHAGKDAFATVWHRSASGAVDLWRITRRTSEAPTRPLRWHDGVPAGWRLERDRP